MSNVNVRKITIEVGTKEEAVAELRKQLGDEVPSDVLDAIVARMTAKMDNGETEGVETVEGEQPIRREDLNGIADCIMALPADQRVGAMRDVIVRMGAQFGKTPEESFAQAAESVERAKEMFGILGMPLPDDVLAFASGMSTQPEKVQAKNPDPRKPETKKADAAKAERVKRFEESIKKLHKAGYTKSALCHIRTWHNIEDGLTDALVDLFHLADGDGDHKHYPSAVEFQNLDGYIVRSWEMVYGMLRHAEVDPTTLGFPSEASFREGNHVIDEYRERVQKTIANNVAVKPHEVN